MFSALVVADDGLAPISYMVVAPAKSGGVDMTYLNIYFLKEEKGRVRDEYFSDWEYKGTLQDNVTVLNYDALDCYLVPTSGGTLVLKREASYAD